MKYFFTFLLICAVQFVHAQYDTIYMAVLPFHSTSASSQDFVEATRAFVIETLSKDYRFVLVERDEFDAVYKEREYQKSEDFIDGKIVEQGKAVGADFLLEGYYDASINRLSFNIFEVKNGSLKCSIVANKARMENESGLSKLLQKAVDLENSNQSAVARNRIKPSRYVIETNIKQLVRDCFQQKMWTVIRPISETGSKVKQLLIAAGSRMGLKKGTIVEIQVLLSEEIDGVALERMESAGWGRVIKVESENFSILKIEAGAKNIKKQLAAGHKLKCRYIKK